MRTLDTIFRAQAKLGPECTATISGGEQKSYAELARRVTHVAGRLAASQVQPGDVVGINIPRGSDLAAAVLGVLEAGCSYVPFDLGLPVARLEAMAKQADVKRVLVNEPDVVTPVGVEAVALEGPVACSPHLESGPEIAAYTLFTSGSSGTPKGVRVPHRAVVNLLEWPIHRYQPGDRVLMRTPLSFDVSVAELLLPLCRGATVVFAPPGEHGNPEVIADLIADCACTHIAFTPSLARSFCAVADAIRCPSVQQILIGGEALSREIADTLIESFPDVRRYNVYGVTEAAVDFTFGPIDAGPIRIGEPGPACRVHVVDPDMREVTPGDAGELILAGPQVALGYCADERATRAAFIPDVWDDPSRPAFRTGDRVRMLEDGALEFIGRTDRQVKVRGFRVELGEVEAALLRQPSVEQARVFVQRSGGTRGGELVAQIVLSTGAVGDVHDGLCDLLPGYMVPRLVPVAELPLSAHEKVVLVPQVQDDVRGPESPDEELVAEVWRRVLELDVVGRDQRFFDLGGDSLSATDVVAMLEREHQRSIALRVMLSNPRLCEVAAGLGAAPRRRRSIGRRGPRCGSETCRWTLIELPEGTEVPAVERVVNRVAQGDARWRTQRSEDTMTAVPSVRIPLRRVRHDVAQAPDERRIRALLGSLGVDRIDPTRAPLSRGAILEYGDHARFLLLATHPDAFDPDAFEALRRALANAPKEHR